MRIAQVAPLYEAVPPKFYGGTERVVSYLTEELVRRGHDVTLFASGESVTKAKLVVCRDKPIRLDPTANDALAEHYRMLEEVFRRELEFDLLHFHIDYLHFPISRRSPVTQVTTLHGRLDKPELGPLYKEYSDMPVVSISNSQRAPLSQARWVGTIYHGLPQDLYQLNTSPEDYLVFIGRLSPEKGVDRAIELAKKSGRRLKIAAKISEKEPAYYHDYLKPLMDHPLIEYLGEFGEKDKTRLLQGAAALVSPVDWPEPFGLAMIEAMACGTPVIAWRRGSVPEVVQDGITGYIVDDVDGAVKAAKRLGRLRRKKVRQIFEERFSVERMADDYLEMFERIRGASFALSRGGP